MQQGQYSNAPPAYQPQPNPQGYPPQPGYPGQQPPPGPGYAAPPPGPGYAAPPQGPGYGAPPQGPGYGAPPQPYPPQPVMQSSVQQSNTTVIIQQPQTSVTAIIRTQPPDYMGLSIFTCLCCFWPLGLVAIIFSSQVSSHFNAGNFDEAAISALRARNCSYCAIGCAIVFYIIIIASLA